MTRQRCQYAECNRRMKYRLQSSTLHWDSIILIFHSHFLCCQATISQRHNVTMSQCHNIIAINCCPSPNVTSNETKISTSHSVLEKHQKLFGPHQMAQWDSHLSWTAVVRLRWVETMKNKVQSRHTSALYSDLSVGGVTLTENRYYDDSIVTWPALHNWDTPRPLTYKSRSRWG